MGTIQHNAIIVTTYDGASAQRLVFEAQALGMQVLGPVMSHINGYYTLCVTPDGSKEGWTDSNEGDDRREAFRQYLMEHNEEGYPYWVEVAYGELGYDLVHTDNEVPADED